MWYVIWCTPRFYIAAINANNSKILRIWVVYLESMWVIQVGKIIVTYKSIAKVANGLISLKFSLKEHIYKFLTSLFEHFIVSSRWTLPLNHIHHRVIYILENSFLTVLPPYLYLTNKWKWKQPGNLLMDYRTNSSILKILSYTNLCNHSSWKPLICIHM